MRWKVKVDGHPHDLADLEKAAGGIAGTSAFSHGSNTFLYAESFERMNSAKEVKDAAKTLLATVNACLRLSDTNAQPLTIGSVVDATGAVTEFIDVQLAEIRLRGGEVTPVYSGNATNPRPPAESMLAKRARQISSYPEVAKAVKLLTAPDETLVSLAKAYEIVKGDLGHGDQKLGGQKAAAISGVSEQELFDFLENVNYPALSGDMSRHAGKNTKRQPKRIVAKLSHAEATDLVRRVVLAWIDARELGILYSASCRGGGSTIGLRAACSSASAYS